MDSRDPKINELRVLIPSNQATAQSAVAAILLPEQSQTKLVRRLALFVTHFEDALSKRCVQNAKKIPGFTISEIKSGLRDAEAPARTILVERLLSDVNNAERASPFHEIMLNTEFNLGYGGKNVLAILALKEQINGLQTINERHFICVETDAEASAARKAHMLPVKLFLKGSGGDISDDEFQALRGKDSGLYDQMVSMEAQTNYSFNKINFMKFMALLRKLSSPATPSLKAAKPIKILHDGASSVHSGIAAAMFSFSASSPVAASTAAGNEKTELVTDSSSAIDISEINLDPTSLGSSQSVGMLPAGDDNNASWMKLFYLSGSADECDIPFEDQYDLITGIDTMPFVKQLDLVAHRSRLFSYKEANKPAEPVSESTLRREF